MLSSMVKEHHVKQQLRKEMQGNFIKEVLLRVFLCIALISLTDILGKFIMRRPKDETKRKEACAAANNLTQALVEHLNVGVAQAYLNQKRLDAEAKQLHTSATNFSKQTQQWANLVETFSSSLKELGDVENWSKTIEGDVRTITIALENVYRSSQENAAATQ